MLLKSTARIRTTWCWGCCAVVFGLSSISSFTDCLWKAVIQTSCFLCVSVFEISPNMVSLFSAPQRPIATQRTTAAPKAGPGMVRKNPGVGNGDDEAAELVQQVCLSCVVDIVIVRSLLHS